MDEDPPPPALRRAWDYKAWGIDLMKMKPGEIPTVSRALFAYNALSGYFRSSGNTVEWTKRNPDAWAFVAQIIKARKAGGL